LLSTTISFEFVLAINLRERFAMVRAMRMFLAWASALRRRCTKF